MEYQKDNVSSFRTNADAFKIANEPRKVNKLQNQFPDHFVGLTDNEKEEARYALVAILTDNNEE